MSGKENVVPRDYRRSISVLDREIAGRVRSDLPGSGPLQMVGPEPPIIAGGEAEAPEAEDQAGDEGGDVGVDGGHRAG